MIKYHYPDGTHCFRGLHTAHAVFYDEDGKLIARVTKHDEDGFKEFEITGFELIGPGFVYEGTNHGE